jgi:hypothetical protein
MINFVFVRDRCGNKEFRLNCSMIDNNNQKVIIQLQLRQAIIIPKIRGRLIDG